MKFALSLISAAGVVSLISGCSSTKPPKPVPVPVATAERSAAEAAKLSSVGQWPRAASAWQMALDEYRLLNDQTNEAIALHNLGEAKGRAGDLKGAHELLESAASINSKLKLDRQWWRDQIALLQIEAETPQPNGPGDRFKRLGPRSKELSDREIKALFLNELGLWQLRNGDTRNASDTFVEALDLFRSSKDLFGAATVVANQALLLEKENNPKEAADKWASALQQFEALADTNGIAFCLAGRGRALLAARVNLPEAEDLLRRAANNFRLLHMEKKAAETEALEKQAISAQGKESPKSR